MVEVLIASLLGFSIGAVIGAHLLRMKQTKIRDVLIESEVLVAPEPPDTLTSRNEISLETAKAYESGKMTNEQMAEMLRACGREAQVGPDGKVRVLGLESK